MSPSIISVYYVTISPLLLWPFQLPYVQCFQGLYFSFLLHAYVLSHFSHVRLFVTLWTVACQAPLFMGFSRQEYWSGLPCPPPGILPTQESNPYLLSLLQCQANSFPVVLPGKLFHSITLYFMSFYIFKCFLIFSPKICVFYWPLRPCTFGVSINMFRFITMLQL